MVLGALPALEEQPGQQIQGQRWWSGTPDIGKQVTDCVAGHEKVELNHISRQRPSQETVQMIQRLWSNRRKAFQDSCSHTGSKFTAAKQFPGPLLYHLLIPNLFTKGHLHVTIHGKDGWSSTKDSGLPIHGMQLLLRSRFQAKDHIP